MFATTVIELVHCLLKKQRSFPFPQSVFRFLLLLWRSAVAVPAVLVIVAVQVARVLLRLVLCRTQALASVTHRLAITTSRPSTYAVNHQLTSFTRARLPPRLPPRFHKMFVVAIDNGSTFFLRHLTYGDGAPFLLGSFMRVLAL